MPSFNHDFLGLRKPSLHGHDHSDNVGLHKLILVRSMKGLIVAENIPTLGELFEARHLRIDAVALLAEVDTSVVSRWRSGQAKPRATSLIRLAQALGISVTRMRKIVDRTIADAVAATKEVA